MNKEDTSLMLERWVGSREQVENYKEVIERNVHIKSLIRQYRLTIEEAIALRHYSSIGFYINDILVGSEKFTEIEKSIGHAASNLLRSALEKLPNYTETAVLSRQDFKGNILHNLQQYKEVIVPGFLSANIGFDIKSHRKHRLIINSKTGKHIAWISENNDTEDEVLFKDHTSFRVLYIETNDNNDEIPSGEIWFYLEEV